MHADLTNLKEKMIIKLNINGNLMQEHQHNIILGLGVSISGFQIAPRLNYDRGDYDCILMLKNTSTIESMPQFSKDYYFILDTTISQLLATTNQ